MVRPRFSFTAIAVVGGHWLLHRLRRGGKRLVRFWPKIPYTLRKLQWSAWVVRCDFCEPGAVLYSGTHSADAGKWIFHDEDWIRVRHRREHRRLVSQGIAPAVRDVPQPWTGEVCVKPDGTWEFQGQTRSLDEWIYLYLDPNEYPWRNYRWNFRVRRLSPFRELQFGFRYQDFYNRYRIRFEDDRVFFDKVWRGRFYNDLASARFPMVLGRWYDIQIDCWHNRFRCCVDGRWILTAWDFADSFPTGSVAVILWEDDGQTDIRAELDGLQIRKLIGANKSTGTAGEGA